MAEIVQMEAVKDAAIKSPGRPPVRRQDETLDLLITAASDEYRLKGYAKSSMGAIAKRAGISLRTLYKFVEDKEALFRLAIERRISQHILTLDALSTSEQATAAQALRELTRAYAYLLLNEDAILTTKLIISEGESFPELARTFVDSSKRIASAFDHHVAMTLSSSAYGDYIHAGEVMRMMLGGSQRAAMLDSTSTYSNKDIHALADRCSDLVLASTAMRQALSS